ncbi:hypothetical protein BHAOGJBA_1323 [Methylobacterium hispanicum]|uniref:Uncharacterized protein n=1 Tax=Methylobacterium hispanicum TaxID=270350 RepID=A0AAV4ZHM7_9HYPH|nr:hypothetical protein [Methylobacterium hispanicum]GJD87818.1 hypothetical protein BHAOGJBA_1323 [Methylobacterium hispanicum]
MNVHARAFRNAATFSGLMAAGALAGSYTRADGAFAVLGGAVACQTAVMLAAWISGADARTWTRGRILTACLPSYAAAATGLALAFGRGITGLHATDLCFLAAVLVLQGRMFAAHISGADGSRDAEPIRARVLVPSRARDAVARVRQP